MIDSKAVATPLPPRNLNHTGSNGPITTQSPQAPWRSRMLRQLRRQQTATTPFAASSNNVKIPAMARYARDIRRTDVAAPCSRTSFLPKSFARISPNGMDPSRYPASTTIAIPGSSRHQTLALRHKGKRLNRSVLRSRGFQFAFDQIKFTGDCVTKIVGGVSFHSVGQGW